MPWTHSGLVGPLVLVEDGVEEVVDCLLFNLLPLFLWLGGAAREEFVLSWMCLWDWVRFGST